MDEKTKENLKRYYTLLSVDELVQHKEAIGNLLAHTKVKDLDDIKISIALINDELKVRNDKLL